MRLPLGREGFGSLCLPSHNVALLWVIPILTIGVAALRVKYGEGKLQATFSASVATFPQHGGTDEELLRAADRALYTEAAGRNCVKYLPHAKPISA